MSGYEYDITFTIRRMSQEDDDYTEIGFGATGGWSTPEQAVHILASAVARYEWETELGMPDPDDVRDDVEAGR